MARNKLIGIILALMWTACLASGAKALINIEYWDGSVWQPVSGSPVQPNTDITITDPGGLKYRVWADNPTSPTLGSIGDIQLISQSGLTPVLFVGKGLLNPEENTPLSISGAYNIGAISFSGGSPSLQVRVNNNIGGDVVFWHIVRLDAGFTISGNVFHEPTGATGTPPRLGTISARQIGSPELSTKSIIAKEGDIFHILATNDILHNIQSDNGSIDTVQAGTENVSDGRIKSPKILALNGSIGTVFATLYVGAPSGPKTKIQAKNGIDRVAAGDEFQMYGYIAADITANANGGNGDITRLEAPFNYGRFDGSLTAHNALGDGGYDAIIFDGDLNGSIVLASDFQQRILVRGGFLAGNTISIGGSLSSGASINIGTSVGSGGDCLAGQVIINANNNASTWSSGSTVGILCNGTPITLSPIPSYSNTSASFGGGAVGQAPFNFHAPDCTPAHDSSTAIGSFPSAVIVRHYGPVYWSSGTPLLIYARVGTGSYTDYTSDFSVTPVTGNNHRDIQIIQKAGATLGWAAGYNYKIVPAVANLSYSHALRCLDVVGKPAVVAYEYKFTITP